MNYFLEFYSGVSRQGPGDSKSTEQALAMLGALPNPSNVLDIGCGSGSQTLLLAQLMRCTITAVDLHDCFLNNLRATVQRVGLNDRIQPVTASMENLPFADAEFDLIWSEGAIYIMGFEKGLQQWKNLLKQGGSLVVSEISWLRKDIPQELKSYWESIYPGIGSIAANVTRIEKAGYAPLGHFILPQNAWLTNYYAPLEAKKQIFLTKYGHEEEAQRVVTEFEEEVAIYKQWKEYYGYVFYLARKL